MKINLLLAIGLSVTTALASEGPFAQRQKLELRSATPSAATIPRYGTLALKLDLAATYGNPFDPEQVDVHGLFTGPGGKQFQVKGFLDQPFSRRIENGREQIQPAGEPYWKIFFTPSIAGPWTYRISAKDKSGSVSLPEARFEVTESKARGFIRRAPLNPYGFAWDNGEPYFAIGENMCWGGGRGSFDYDDWLPQLGKAGGNFIRIWMCSWNCALEWASESRGEQRSGGYHGVAVYSLDNAWKLDTILNLADHNGISVMLCLGTYGEFNQGGYFNEGQWKANPYNVANGGPCAKPEEFWTRPEARKLYQRRLRYLAARYGHRTNLQSWEFWNEAKAPAPWVAEMARCMKGTGEFQGRGADPYGHLVTTTYGDSDVWRTPEIDFTQTHSYGTGNIKDHGPVIVTEARKHAEYRKPHLTGEYGIDWRSPDSKYDADGKAINLHNGLWAGLVSGDGGGAMVWWWDNYVHPKKLYSQFTAPRRFADTIPWQRGEWKKLNLAVSSTGGASQNQTPAQDPSSVVHAHGLINGDTAIAWIQNASSNWKNVYERKEIPALNNVEITVRETPSTRYQVRWWDTLSGEVTKQESVSATNGELKLTIPALEHDVALVLTAQEDK